VDALLERVTERTRVVFLANPNNPTGSYIPFSEVRRLHDGLPRHVLMVLDAAYAEYMDVPDYEAGLSLVEECENVVVTRTFSKIHALGGLRIGWAYCPAGVADTLNRCRSPFNVSAAAEAAAIAALGDRDFVTMSRKHNAEWRTWLDGELRRLGFDPKPGVTNFILVGIGNAARAGAVHRFLGERLIQVRPMDGYGLPDYLRITIGREEQMRALVAALEAFRIEEAT
jgi:histidinol-phosphate aminotransferase